MAKKKIDQFPNKTVPIGTDIFLLEDVAGDYYKVSKTNLEASLGGFQSLQDVITVDATVNGLLAQSFDTLTIIEIADGSVGINSSDGTDASQFTITPAAITHGVNFTTQVITDDLIEYNTASLKKNGVEVAIITDVSGLAASIALKANIASPTLTGVPNSTTAAFGTRTVQIATTEFVDIEADIILSNSFAISQGYINI